MTEKLWTPPAKTDPATKHSFGFPPAVIRAALLAARQGIKSAEMPAADRQRKRAKRRASTKARRKNRR